MGLLRSAAQVVMAMSIVFLLLLVFALSFGDPGTSSYVTAQLAAIPIVLSLVASLAVLYTGWEPFP